MALDLKKPIVHGNEIDMDKYKININNVSGIVFFYYTSFQKLTLVNTQKPTEKAFISLVLPPLKQSSSVQFTL